MESQREEDITKDIEEEEEEIKIMKNTMEREDLKTKSLALSQNMKKLRKLKRTTMTHHWKQVINNQKQDNLSESK